MKSVRKLLALLVCSIISMTVGYTLPPAENKDTTSPRDIKLSSNVTFSAFRNRKLDFSKEVHKPVKFEGVTDNRGGHFNPYTGFFTAPTLGLYVFTYSTPKTYSRRVRLMKNNLEIEVLSNDGKGRQRKHKNGEEILLQLETNDRVWLHLSRGKRRIDVIDGTLNSTTFSGYLLTTQINTDLPRHHGRVPANKHKHTSGGGRPKRDIFLFPTDRIVSKPIQTIEREVDESVELINRQDTNPTEVKPAAKNVTVAPKIAFSVTCTKSMIGGHVANTHVSINGAMEKEEIPNGKIPFDKIFVNLANGFDIETSEFIAPTSGVYFFSYNVGKFPRKKLSVMLMKNVNEVQSIIYNDSKSRAREIQGQSLMLILKESDRIWLRSYNGDEYAVYSNLGNYITFNGYLVYEL